MHPTSPWSQLLEFPCDFEFKAFGVAAADGDFAAEVREAVSSVVSVPLDAVRTRPSSRGTYLCVTVVARLHNAEQVKSIYEALRRIEGLKYLL